MPAEQSPGLVTTPSIDPLALARRPERLATLAFAGAITQSLRTGRRPLIRGLAEEDFRALVDKYFVGVELDNGGAETAADEFDDLLDLLLEHRPDPDQEAVWMAHAVASSAMGGNHLYQDMGLPSRREMSVLLREYFPALAAKNTGDMRWKKFFYRQLCERAEVPICKSPHCSECTDYRVCFSVDP